MDKETVCLLALSESDFEFARSAGAGGQNVNKVSSKAILRWNLRHSALPATTLSSIRLGLSRFLTVNDEIVISSQEARDQLRNRQICEGKLVSAITAALTPQKKRRPTKPTYSSKLRRLDSKSKMKTKKNNRSGNWD